MAGYIKRITYPEGLFQDLQKYRQTPFYRKFGTAKEMNVVKRIFSSVDGSNAIQDKFKMTMSFSTPELVKYCYDFDRNSLLFAKYVLNKDKNLDLIMVYFEGIDIFSHAFWCFRTPKLYPGLEEGQLKRYKRYGNMVEDYYILIDSYLGQILQYLNNNDILILCSDHGFRAEENYLQRLQVGNVLTGDHRPEGIFIMYGKHIKKNRILKHVSLLDALPTVLYLNGIPISVKFPGAIRFDCIEERFMKKTKPVFISDYRTKDKRETSLRSQQEYPFHDEIMRRLKALGYLN